ncbi:MAG: biotin/lipoyl-containing protein [Opitutaceae bacterium]|nr:biotin/lipoyl-containing protein [Opitutaceae bacterium]
MKKLRVTVAGKSYDVLVEVLDSAPQGGTTPPMQAASLLAAPVSAPVAPAAAPKAPAAGGAGDIPCPIAGKVVSVDVQVGQAIEEGKQVATVEAMKMNTYIYAPKAGTVASIHVNIGDGVEEGTVMIKLA